MLQACLQHFKPSITYKFCVILFQDELLDAEKHLKSALEMLLIEPGNSPEGELCAKALELYRTLKNTMRNVLDSIHAEGKSYDSVAEKEFRESMELTEVD